MRVVFGVTLSFLLMSGLARGQTLVLHGSGGPTITDAGYSLATGIGFSPISRLTILFGIEHTSLSSRFTRDSRGRVTSAFRGGAITFATAEVRAAIFRHDRLSPYGLGGFGAGDSRPHINEAFPTRVTNQARVLFVGGGLHVPLRERISVFGEVRMVLGAEGNEGIVAYAPVRAGIAWRF